jgi:hypothetical protein
MDKTIILILLSFVAVVAMIIISAPQAEEVIDQAQRYEDCVMTEYGLTPQELKNINGEYPDCQL